MHLQIGLLGHFIVHFALKIGGDKTLSPPYKLIANKTPGSGKGTRTLFSAALQRLTYGHMPEFSLHHGQGFLIVLPEIQ